MYGEAYAAHACFRLFAWRIHSAFGCLYVASILHDQCIVLLHHAGTNIWMISGDGFGDYDQFEIYGDEAGTAQPLPAGNPLTMDWAQTLARQAVFRNYVAADACVRSRFQGDRSASSSFVSGWDETLNILSVNRTFSGSS